MNITDIRIRKTFQENNLRALVSITVDNALAIHDIKVIDGPNRLFVAMPSRKDDRGVFRDVAHPIGTEARAELENAILLAYHTFLQEEQKETTPQSGNSDRGQSKRDQPQFITEGVACQ